jgi:pyruvate dehydrogenase E2 component (dihydrolipoamide acetyltransferase)
VNLGVAWAPRENVLIVPTLADCAGWDLQRFGEALAALKRRSAEDAFLATDFKTPTFTVSNLGATGIDDFTSLVTPPQVAVLSVSAATIRAAERDGALVAEQVLPLTLGIDHRALDGAYAARALVDLAGTIAEATA